MGYIENLQAQAQQAAKAKAYDDMQLKDTLKTAYKQGNGDAYEAGRRDTAAELNALMAEAAKQERAGLAASYDAQPTYPQGQELFQGGQMPQGRVMPDLRTSNETQLPAPAQGLAQSAVR
jgi:hypothetical protein